MEYADAKHLIRSLEGGTIIPVTKAAANLADQIQTATEQPTVVTQNGYGLGIIMSMDFYKRFRDLAYEGLDSVKNPTDYIRALERGAIIPVTKASANLADQIQAASKQPTIVTQNGYGLGILLSLDLYNQLRELALEGFVAIEAHTKEPAGKHQSRHL